MKISVRVKPNSHKNAVKKAGENRYLVSVTAPPVERKANATLIEVLSKYFGKTKSRITILKGLTGREKLIEII